MCLPTYIAALRAALVAAHVTLSMRHNCRLIINAASLPSYLAALQAVLIAALQAVLIAATLPTLLRHHCRLACGTCRLINAASLPTYIAALRAVLIAAHVTLSMRRNCRLIINAALLPSYLAALQAVLSCGTPGRLDGGNITDFTVASLPS
jgi:hypothetical protein